MSCTVYIILNPADHATHGMPYQSMNPGDPKKDNSHETAMEIDHA
jgi:hypothetical protein